MPPPGRRQRREASSDASRGRRATEYPRQTSRFRWTFRPDPEELEDRTLLSGIDYGAVGVEVYNQLVTAQTGIVNSLVDSIPFVGTALKQLPGINNLLGQFDDTLKKDLATASAATLQSEIASALNGLLLGGVQITPVGSDGGFDVTARLHKTYTPVSASNADNFGLGKFLTFNTANTLDVTLTFDYLLGFSVDAQSDVTLDQTDLNKGVPKLGVAGDATLPDTPLAFGVNVALDGFSATGKLNGLLAVHAQPAPGSGGPNFNGEFGVSLTPQGTATTTLTGDADANLALALNFDGNGPAFGNTNPTAAIDPELTATFHVHWHFGGNDPADNDESTFGSLTDLSFSNIRLDIGSLFPGFINTIVSDVQKVTKPLQSIVDFLNNPLPVLDKIGVHLSIRQIIEESGSSGLGTVLDDINFINNDLPSTSTGSSSIGLGSFSFVNKTNPAATLAALLGPTGAASLLSTDSIDLPSPDELTAAADGDSGGFFESGSSGSSTPPVFSFPIVTDPEHVVWQLLAGQDATLFNFNAAFAKHAGASVGAYFGVFGVFLSGSIDVAASVSAGYDTRGLRDFVADGNPLDLLDGFYVDNGNTGPFKPNTGISLMGNITAGASLLGVTLTGGIDFKGEVTIAPSKDDKPPDPDGVTRAHLDKLLDSSTGPLFAASGEVDATLDLSYGFTFPVLGTVTLFSYNIANAVIYRFAIGADSSDQDSAPFTHTILINETDGDQTIHVHQKTKVNYTYEGFPDNDPRNYTTEYYIVVDYGTSQDAYYIGTKTYDTGRHGWVWQPGARYDFVATAPFPDGKEPTGDHTIIVDANAVGGYEGGVNPATGELVQPHPLDAILIGGIGNDDLEYHANGQAMLVGGGGSNTLIGGRTEYGNYPDLYLVNSTGVLNLYPEFLPPFDTGPFTATAPDPLAGVKRSLALLIGKGPKGTGFNTLVGTPRNDLLVGGPAGNNIDGQGGSDREYGGVGNDVFDVGDDGASDHQVEVHGRGGSDSLMVNTVDQERLANVTVSTGSLSGMADPYRLSASELPALVASPTVGLSILAVDVPKISLDDVVGTVSVGDLSSTAAKVLQLTLTHALTNSPIFGDTGQAKDRVNIAGGSAGDRFTVDSALEGSFTSTTVQDFEFGHGTFVTLINDFAAQDTLAINGGGDNDTNGDHFVVDLNVDTPFGVHVNDALGISGNLLTVDGSAFSRPTDLRPRFRTTQSDNVVVGSTVLFTNTTTRFATVPPATVTSQASVQYDVSIPNLVVIAPDVANSIQVGSYLHVANAVIYGGSAPNTFDVRGFLGKLALEGGARDDVFNILSVIDPKDVIAGNRDFVGGSLVIDGVGGSDVMNLDHVELYKGSVSVSDANGLATVNVDDSTDTTVRNVNIDAYEITGFAAPFITYQPGQLASLNIVGSRIHIAGSQRGVINILPEGNIYDVIGTPGYNRYGQLVTTTLTPEGTGGDTVNVLAVAEPGTHLNGMVGTLAIVSPLKLTTLNIYGAPPNQPVLKSFGGFGATQTLSRVFGASTRAASPFSLASGTQFNPPSSTTNPVGQIPAPVIIDSDRVSGLAPGDIDFGPDQLLSLTVYTPTGASNVNVWGTPNQGAVGSVATSVIGDGPDTVYVGDGVSGLRRIQGKLSVTNPPSYSTLIVDASGDTAGRSAIFAPGLITGLAPAGVSYVPSDVKAIGLVGGAGNDTFHEVATTPGVPVIIDGGGGANTFIGPNLVNNWRVSAVDAGALGIVSFLRVGSLVGGTLADTFALSNGAGLSGRLDGGGGVNTLDESTYTGGSVVNLATGTATGVYGGVANIANVDGARGYAILVGNADANVLKGGAGYNLIIGGGGTDQVVGGAGQNILIGGTTAYDLDTASLDLLMQEFAQPNESFVVRLANLLSGGGANGEVLLNPTTVSKFGQAATLTGGTGPNWFFVRGGLDRISFGTSHPKDVTTNV
jgi:RTX calcium-binding nonapeptide repeat (4 copies)